MTKTNFCLLGRKGKKRKKQRLAQRPLVPPPSRGNSFFAALPLFPSDSIFVPCKSDHTRLLHCCSGASWQSFTPIISDSYAGNTLFTFWSTEGTHTSSTGVLFLPSRAIAYIRPVVREFEVPGDHHGRTDTGGAATRLLAHHQILISLFFPGPSAHLPYFSHIGSESGILFVQAGRAVRVLIYCT